MVTTVVASPSNEANVNSETVAGSDKYCSRKYRYYALSMLMTAYMFNFIDRQIISILQEPIKQELSLSDTQLGLLTGVAFAIFYVLMGLPIARLADKGSRRNIIAVSIAVWSFFTAICGMTANFFQLLAARIGVGVGEAGCSPPSHSMISDIFPASERGTALGVYNMGVNFGILIGFLVGGWLNEFFGWRMAFFAVAIPGLVLAVIVRMTVAEPKRIINNRPDDKKADLPSIKEVLRHLLTLHTFRHVAIATGMLAFAGYGLLNWLPSFFIRIHGLGTGTVGTWFALTLGVGGAIGTFAGGWLADRLGRKDLRWYLWIVIIATVLAVPLIIATLSVESSFIALLCNIYPGAVLALYLAPLIAVTHGLVDNRMRALSSAILFLVLNLLGLGLGPLVIGLMSDLLAPVYAVESLRYAMLITIPVVSIWGCVHLLLASKHIRREMVFVANK